MKRRLGAFAFLLCAALAALSCDESLPVRADPEVVLVPGMRLSGDLVHVASGQVKWGGAVVLSMRNVHDEVLSEAELVRAHLSMFLREYPDSVGSVVYGPLDLLTPGMIVGNTFTLRVQEVAEFVRPWSHRTAAGTPFWELGMKFNRRVTDKGVTYYESDPVHLVVSATLQIFERVQAARLATSEFTIVYELWQMPSPVLAGSPQ